MVYCFRPFELQTVKIRNKELDNKPKPRSGHRIVSDGSSLYCFGGYCPNQNSTVGGLFLEMWKFNIFTSEWKLLISPEMKDMPKEVASCASWMLGDVIIVYGGTGYPFGVACSNNCHIIFTNRNIPVIRQLDTTGELPKPQYGQAVTLAGEQFYTVGGTTGYDYCCDVHRLNFSSKQWECLFKSGHEREGPAGRYRHGLVHQDGFLYVLGGGTSGSAFSLEQIPTFDLTELKWSLSKSKPDEIFGFPAPRRCHSCVQHENKALITGGCSLDNYFNDIWLLNLTTMQWKLLAESKLPHSLFFHDACILSTSCMFIFGGVQVDRDTHVRTNDLLKIWIDIPKLSEICWDAISYYAPHLSLKSTQELINLGIPRDLTKRLPLIDAINVPAPKR